MAIPGWTQTESPFHAGELAIQTRMGVKERMNALGRRVIRDFMPDQHRQFFSQLPYLIVGTVDSSGSPWASILVGEIGFLSSPNDRTLQVRAKPLFGDPLANTLAESIDIGILGIELHTRRRNRMNGIVTATHDDGFEVLVRQSFGNCNKYIQARMFALVDVEPAIPRLVHQFTTLDPVDQVTIATADTLFIASAYQGESVGAASGVDVSHRGGNPGFVRVDDDQTLTLADFAGNCLFNTFGNLEVNPHAGLLFVDFEKGDLLYLTGTAKVIWQGDEIATFPGAQRLLRFHLHQGYRVEKSLPIRWSDPEISPVLLEGTFQ